MSILDRTKILLAEELKRQSRTVPLRRFKVVDLCAACGIDRRTFYYHFRDVYDLMAWEYNRTVDDCLPGKGRNPGIAGFAEALTKIRKDGYYYRWTLSEDSQNSLGRYILQHNVEIYEEALKQVFGTDALSEKDSFAIGYHCFGSLGMLRRWLFADCTPPPEEMAARMIAAMPPVLLRLYVPDHE